MTQNTTNLVKQVMRELGMGIHAIAQKLSVSIKQLNRWADRPETIPDAKALILREIHCHYARAIH